MVIVKTENINTLEDLQSQGYCKMKSPKKTISKGDHQSLRKETDSVPDISRDCLDIENNTASAAIPSESPQPGPSGLQQSNSNLPPKQLSTQSTTEQHSTTDAPTYPPSDDSRDAWLAPSLLPAFEGYAIPSL